MWLFTCTIMMQNLMNIYTSFGLIDILLNISLFITQECVNGTFGYDCVKKCSGHCVYDSPCNKKTGVCDMGCNPGYFDTYCSRG